MTCVGPEEGGEKKRQADGGEGETLWPQGMRQSIYDHTDIKKRGKQKRTLNTQWCLELRCMIYVRRSQVIYHCFSLSVFPVSHYFTF